MATDTVERCTFEARLECHYLLHAPTQVDDRTLLVLTLHGYGSNPDVMLRLTKTMLGTDHVIASIQAPSQFYPSNAPESTVGYCWASRTRIRSRRCGCIMRWCCTWQPKLSARFGIAANRRLLVGFSQPVGLNYRFAATHPDEVRGVIGICGGLPKNWDEAGLRQDHRQPAVTSLAARTKSFRPP